MPQILTGIPMTTDVANEPAVTIDDAPVRAFHWRLLAFVAGGMFIDGYIIGIVIGVFPRVPASFGLTSNYMGLLAAAPLIGLCLGSLLLGPVTDALGRKPLF